MKRLGSKLKKFKLDPKYTHHRSEGLTHRGQKHVSTLSSGGTMPPEYIVVGASEEEMWSEYFATWEEAVNRYDEWRELGHTATLAYVLEGN